MAPRSKQCTKRAPGTEESAGKAKISGWERSKLSAQDQKLLKKMGLLNKEAIKMPGDESSPHPPIGFRDLEKLVRRFTSLNKNHEIPSSCRVEPFSGRNALPENHQTLSSLPPLPEGGEVDDRVVVADDSQESSLPESEPAGSQRSAGSSDKDTESEQRSDSAHSVSPPPANSPDGRKRKRNDDEDSGASKLAEPATEEPSPEDQEFFDPFAETGVPLMKELVNLGSQFIGFRDEAATLRDALRRAEERADDLEAKLEASEAARKKAENDAAAAERLRQKLQATEDALSNKEAQQIKRENEISTCLETQSRRFSRKMGEQYNFSQESDDRLLDTLDILELNCDLACKFITSARDALKRVFPHFFPKETQPETFSQLAHHFLAKDDPALAYHQASLKIGVEGTVALVAASGQKIDWVKTAAPKGLNSEKWKALVKDAKLYSKKIIAFLDPKSSASASVAQTEVK
ncbi:hypothetical protein ACQ4PT_040687 [Festuca glaucescens]